MIPRLTVCFGLSVLLHGMLLLSVAPTFRTGGSGYLQAGNIESKKMVVILEAARSNTKPPEAIATTKRSDKPEAAPPAPVKPAGILLPPVASPAQPASGLGWLVQPPPDARDPQMNYRQLYEMQARQQMIQQAQMFTARLQADIEQSINLRGEPVIGQCVWQGDSSSFQCDQKALLRRMQPEADKLSALRSAMKNQSIILDGFTVGTSGDRSSITYQVHSAKSDPAP